MLEFQISKFAGNFNIENYNGAEGAENFNIEISIVNFVNNFYIEIRIAPKAPTIFIWKF